MNANSHWQSVWGHSAFSAARRKQSVTDRPQRKKQSVPKHQSGLTYVEVLIATLVLLVSLVPALDAMRGAVTGTRVNDSYMANQHRLAGRLEEVLAERFTELDAAAVAAGSPTTPSSYSEAPGTPGRLLIYVARYDGDNADGNGDPFNGGDEGLLWVQAAIESTPYQLETLVSR